MTNQRCSSHSGVSKTKYCHCDALAVKLQSKWGFPSKAGVWRVPASEGVCRNTLPGVSYAHLSENQLEFRASLAGVVTSGLMYLICCSSGTLRLVLTVSTYNYLSFPQETSAFFSYKEALLPVRPKNLLFHFNSVKIGIDVVNFMAEMTSLGGFLPAAYEKALCFTCRIAYDHCTYKVQCITD